MRYLKPSTVGRELKRRGWVHLPDVKHPGGESYMMDGTGGSRLFARVEKRRIVISDGRLTGHSYVHIVAYVSPFRSMAELRIRLHEVEGIYAELCGTRFPHRKAAKQNAAEEVAACLQQREDALLDIATRIFHEVVVPFCDKHNLKFYVSWGDYRFRRMDDSEDEDCWQDFVTNMPPDKATVKANAAAPAGYQDVLDALFIPLGDGNYIYSYMEGMQYRFRQGANNG